MGKKIAVFTVVFLVFSYTVHLYSIEVGAIIGSINKPSRLNYGLSTSMGFLVPMVKFEIELYKKANTETPELPTAITGGLKFRPKFGKFAPYAVAGFGVDFKSISFDFDDYESFTFLGGGLHLFVTGMLSFRADLRFLNYSGYNRTRLSAGLFLHF
jgi:hypothetical protein